MLTEEQQIFEQINKARNILIVFKKTCSGDSISSSLAAFLFLKKMGKNADIAAEQSDASDLYSFLPGHGNIKRKLDNLRKFVISLDIANVKINQVKYKLEKNKLNFIIAPENGFFNHSDVTSSASEFKYDLIMAMGTPDFESLGEIYDKNAEFFYRTPIINIDHDSANENLGQINCVKLAAASTCEIVFSLFESMGRDLIDEDIATCLLAGMIAETKSFKTGNVTPDALLAASKLMAMGARREQIVNHFYRSKNINILKLWGRVLAQLSSAMDGKFIWATMSLRDFSETDSTEKDLIGVIDELIVNIPQAKVAVIIYEKTDANSGIIVYTAKNINAALLIKEFNPSGTKNMCRTIVNLPAAEAERAIVGCVRNKLEKLPS